MFTILFTRLLSLFAPYAHSLRRTAQMTLSRGDTAAAQGIVPLIILIAGFVVTAILVMTFIDKATTNSAADVALCVEGGIHTYGNTTDQCEAKPHSRDNSFRNGNGYQSRYADESPATST